MKGYARPDKRTVLYILLFSLYLNRKRTITKNKNTSKLLMYLILPLTDCLYLSSCHTSLLFVVITNPLVSSGLAIIKRSRHFILATMHLECYLTDSIIFYLFSVKTIDLSTRVYSLESLTVDAVHFHF